MAIPPIAPGTPGYTTLPPNPVTTLPSNQLAQYPIQRATPNISNALNPNQGANLTAQGGIIGNINNANVTRTDYKNQLRQQTLDLKNAKKAKDSPAAIQSIKSAMAQTTANAQQMAQQVNQQTKQQKALAKGAKRAGQQYVPGQNQASYLTPTGVVVPNQTSNPGGAAQPLPSAGDTVTQGHVQQLAKYDGQTVPDFTAASTYQGGQNAFGLSNPGQASESTAVQYGYTNAGQKGFSPGEIYNMQRQVDNANARDSAVRQQQSIDTLRGGQDTQRTLMGQNLADSDQFGTQQNSRIAETEKANQASTAQDLTGRGLTNSTIGSALASRISRDASDQYQGVAESQASQRMNIRSALAGTEAQTTGNIAQTYARQPMTPISAQTLPQFGYVQQKTNKAGPVGQIAGGLIGAYLGGPAGAQMGSSIGGSLGTAYGG